MRYLTLKLSVLKLLAVQRLKDTRVTKLFVVLTVVLVAFAKTVGVNTVVKNIANKHLIQFIQFEMRIHADLVAASWRCYRLHINGCFVHPLSVSVDVISVDVISARVGGGR